MLIFPIGHEKFTVRRLPWVTFGLMAVNIIVLALTLTQGAGAIAETNRLLNDAISFYLDHPDLEAHPLILEILGEPVPDRLEQPAVKRTSRAQETLDALTALALRASAADPFFRFGMVPARPALLSSLTSMFMHGGIMHLLGNLLILYLCAPYLEDRWGHLMFGGIYLAAGFFSGWLYWFMTPGSLLPLIGASGAIAGVMGAFLINFWRNRITFFYWFIVLFGTFTLPAWLVLPLWLLNEFIAGVGQALGPFKTTGVAHWAHVGGFLFGFGAAIAIRFLHFEVKQTDSATPLVRQIEPRRAAEATASLARPASIDPAARPAPTKADTFSGMAGFPSTWQRSTAALISLEERQVSLLHEDGTTRTWPMSCLKMVAVGQANQPDGSRHTRLDLVFRRSDQEAVVLVSLGQDLAGLQRQFPDVAGEPARIRKLLVFLMRYSPARIFPDWNWQRGEYRVFESAEAYYAALYRSFGGY